jgi:hypothetical protein
VKSRSIKLLLVLSLAVVVLIPVTAVASHQFTDVPNSNIFHNDIAWLADNGITKGCNPPANTKYCPEANVTRQQMAAFMHRLAVNRVVDADKLDGMDSTAFKSVAASTSITATVGGGGPAIVLGSVTGLDVPAAGGGILATTTMSATANSGPQLGVLWIEIDGSGSCDATILPGAAVWETVSTGFGSGTALASRAVPAGSHRIDVCHGGFGTATTNIVGKVLVEWVPTVDNFGLLEADKAAGATVDELLAPYADLLDS